MRSDAAPMLSRILPAGALAAEAVASRGGLCLNPEEARALGKASINRLREFSAARNCARLAMQRLGLAPQPILIGADREPVWPKGVVGSITHCSGFCAAAVAPRRMLPTIGIDVEVDAALPAEVLGEVLRPEERGTLDGDQRSKIHWDRVSFSVKESVYKAWFPLTRRWLGFRDVVVTFDRDKGTFTARLLVPAPAVEGRALDCFRGSYLVSDGLIFTAAWL